MNIERIKAMDLLIDKQRTGTPSQFAIKLRISERTIYKYITYMKTTLKAPVAYSKTRQNYYYTENGKLNIIWQKP